MNNAVVYSFTTTSLKPLFIFLTLVESDIHTFFTVTQITLMMGG